jgi:hypothetical protein
VPVVLIVGEAVVKLRNETGDAEPVVAVDDQ